MLTANFKDFRKRSRTTTQTFSSLKENKLWFKENFTFNETGEYTINIQHAMREYGKVNGIMELEGITDVGFRIEQINNQ